MNTFVSDQLIQWHCRRLMMLLQTLDWSRLKFRDFVTKFAMQRRHTVNTSKLSLTIRHSVSTMSPIS